MNLFYNNKAGGKMKCPYCNDEMTEGFVQSARQVFFTTEKHKLSFWAEGNEQILTQDNWTVPTCTAFCCTKCKKVIIDYSDNL